MVETVLDVIRAEMITKPSRRIFRNAAMAHNVRPYKLCQMGICVLVNIKTPGKDNDNVVYSFILLLY